MAITTADGLVAAAKWPITYTKTAAVTSIAANWFSMLDVAGAPGAGSLAIGNTANGVVPDDTTAGFPSIPSFGGGATGYLTTVQYGCTVASRLAIYDRLFHAGSISLTTLGTTTLTSQPSFLGRVPGGAGAECEIWLEINTAVSATATTVAVAYTNSDGTTGRTTGATTSLSGYTTRRLIRLPFQAGDRGVQKIESVTVGGTVATAGTVNVIVARPLWKGRVKIANDGGVDGWDRLQMPVVYDTSALWAMVCADSTSTGIPDLLMTIANG